LGDEAEDVESQTDPGTDCAEHGSEWQVISGSAILSPGLAESNVCEADGAPGEEVGETGDGKQPGKDGSTGFGLIDVSEAAEKESKDQDDVWTTLLINACTDGWAHASSAQSLDCSGRCKGAGVGDGENTEGDDSVED